MIHQPPTYHLFLCVASLSLGASLLGLAGARTESTLLAFAALAAVIAICYVAIFGSRNPPQGPTP